MELRSTSRNKFILIIFLYYYFKAFVLLINNKMCPLIRYLENSYWIFHIFPNLFIIETILQMDKPLQSLDTIVYRGSGLWFPFGPFTFPFSTLLLSRSPNLRGDTMNTMILG